MDYIFLIFSVISVYLVNYYLIKRNILPSFSGDKHQKLASNKSIPLSGGIFLICGFSIIFFQPFQNYLFFLSLIFLIGLYSDLKILKSAKFRLFLQSIIIFIFILIFDIRITDTRIEILDKILNQKIISYLFIAFCILIIVNGSNFLDGLNTLVLGYYLIVSYIIYKMELYYFIGLDPNIFLLWFLFLALIYLLNFFNNLYLGDNGAYFLGFIYAFILVMIFNKNVSISPYFIILLLWYPGFENLFSILRKMNIKKKSPLLPDPKHLHQLMFIYLNQRIIKKKIYANLAVANIINLYNLIVFYFASKNPSDTDFQLLFIILNIFIYTLIYYFLTNSSKKT